MLNPAVVARVDVYSSQQDISRSEAINFILFEFCELNGIYVKVTEKCEGQLNLSEVIA